MAATKGGFWTDSTTQDPKRNYRFLVSIGNMDNGAQWFAKSVSRPSFTVEKTEHMFLNHTFKYPTRTKWDDITVTLVDPVTPDAVNQTMQIIKASGYDPSILTTTDYGTTATKAASVGALGSVTISMVDGVHTGDTGLPFLEKWTLNAPFITGVKSVWARLHPRQVLQRWLRKVTPISLLQHPRCLWICLLRVYFTQKGIHCITWIK